MSIGKAQPKRMLGGIGAFSGPSAGKLFEEVVVLIKMCLPIFAKSATRSGITNENGLNRKLCRFIQNKALQDNLPFLVHPESMEDEMRGDSPSVDIGIYLSCDDICIDPPKISVFEGKRLTIKTDKQRRKEYVFGHEKNGRHIPCGGIERFKLLLHGRNFTKAGMIGYIQEGTYSEWLKRVNIWIDELSTESHNPTWSNKEQLTPVAVEEKISSCSSIVCRFEDEIELIHLWVTLSK